MLFVIKRDQFFETFLCTYFHLFKLYYILNIILQNSDLMLDAFSPSQPSANGNFDRYEDIHFK